LTSAPHWRDPALLPELDPSASWQVFDGKEHRFLSLPEVLERIESGPGQTLWTGQPERADIVFVAAPGANRPEPAIERPELQAALLRHHEKTLAGTFRQNGWFFYPLAVIALGVEILLGKVAMLPAIFAVLTGSAHLEAWLQLRTLRRDPQRYAAEEAARIRYGAWLDLSGGRYRCRVCWIVAAWTAIGALLVALPASIGDAALVKQAVSAQPWRLLTATLLHGSLLHFLMNASAMVSIGALLERGAHRHLVTPVWLLGALAGSLLSWAATPATSVGASGGILAVFTFLLVMGWRRRAQLPPNYGSSLARGMLIIALFGVLAWDAIDNAAHAGGALAGAAIGFWIFRRPRETLPLQDSPTLRAIGRAAEVAFIVLAAFTAAKLLGFA
jgi:membrane associated rhomboid family serine protease